MATSVSYVKAFLSGETAEYQVRNENRADESDEPQSQKVILCLLNKEPILARWIKENHKKYLVADNVAWQPQRLEVSLDDTVVVLGTAVRFVSDI